MIYIGQIVAYPGSVLLPLESFEISYGGFLIVAPSIGVITRQDRHVGILEITAVEDDDGYEDKKWCEALYKAKWRHFQNSPLNFIFLIMM
jgi:hypothetical protein